MNPWSYFPVLFGISQVFGKSTKAPKSGTSFKVTVGEGQSALLPCYFPITNKSVSARWEKKTHVVVERNSYEDQRNGIDGRFSVSSGWEEDGRFFLTLQQTEKADKGVYYCSRQVESGEKVRGYPSVVVLKVKKRASVSSHILSRNKECVCVCRKNLRIGFMKFSIRNSY